MKTRYNLRIHDKSIGYIAAILILAIVTACSSPAQLVPTLTALTAPTNSPSPTATETALPTETPVAQEEPISTPAPAATPVPASSTWPIQPITQANADQLSQLDVWGRGASAGLIPLGENFAWLVVSPSGLYFYDPVDFQLLNTASGVQDYALPAGGAEMVVSYPMTTTVDVRSMVDGSPLTQLTHPLSPLPGTPDDLSGGRRVRGIVFSPDGKLLAISYADHEIELFRTDTWESVQLLQSNLAPLSDSLVITPDNQYLLTSGTLAIWRLIDGELLNRIPNIGDLSTFPLSPDGKLLATTDYANRTVLIYSFPDGRLLYSHRGLEAPASFSADGEYLIVGEQVRRIVDGTRLPADQEGAVLAAQQLPAAPPAVVPDDARLTELRHFPPLHGLLLPAVQQVLAWSQSGQMLSWYDLYAPTASQATLPAEMINRAVPAITNQALAVCLESQLAIVDLGTSEQLILDRCREKGALTFLTDGRTLARASNIGIDLVDLIAGKVVHNLRGHNNLITHLAASPDGQFLASGTKIGGDGAEVYIWKLENRTILQKIKVTSNIDYVETEVQSLAFSPDGSLLAIGGVDDNVKVHRVSDGWQLLILKTGLSALDLEISPDGSLLAAGNQDGSIYVWSLPTGDLLTILTGHVGPVNDILISPTGAALLSAGEDGTVRVWGVP